MSVIKRTTKASTVSRSSKKMSSSAKTPKTIKLKTQASSTAVQMDKSSKLAKGAKKLKSAKLSKLVIKEHQTRVEILQLIADKTNLKRVEVESVFSHMADIVKAHLAQNGSGEVMIPKLGLKIRKVRRKATKKRKMISPLTGSEVVIPAKPARDDVKLIALKTLKEAVV